MDITRQIADHVVSSRMQMVPADVRHEACRALLNYVGCAIGGAHEDAVEIALRALNPYSGNRTSVILGRRDRVDPITASLINGIAAHVHDFDDTTPHNLSHTTCPVASAIISHASQQAVDGSEFLHAFLLGFEAASQIANAIVPGHYEAGWHITSTVGAIGAAVAVGRLRALTAEKMTNAIGIAATQAAGLRVVFGSMAKGFNPGRAAQNGYVAAVLADAGFTGGNDPLGGPRGFLEVLASTRDAGAIAERPPTEFELRHNAYKPFPCGLVMHAAIDACIQLHLEARIDPDEIRSVRLRVAPIVLDLCNKRVIHSGLEGRFSIYHAAAVGLVRGKAGLAEFTDQAVNESRIRAVRERVTVEPDADISHDAATVEITRLDGCSLSKSVAHAIGSLQRPLSDRALEQKFRDQAEPRLGGQRAGALLDLCWALERAGNAGQIAELAAPA
jgi:2-methylcitrate dehydratase PrpD